MIAEHKTEDGFVITVYSACYMDYGVRVEKDGGTVFDNPCYLSNDSYGVKPTEKYEGDYDAAERARYDGSDDEDPFEPWTEKDWQDMLKREEYELLEGAGVYDESRH